MLTTALVIIRSSALYPLAKGAIQMLIIQYYYYYHINVDRCSDSTNFFFQKGAMGRSKVHGGKGAYRKWLIFAIFFTLIGGGGTEPPSSAP